MALAWLQEYILSKPLVLTGVAVSAAAIYLLYRALREEEEPDEYFERLTNDVRRGSYTNREMKKLARSVRRSQAQDDTVDEVNLPLPL